MRKLFFGATILLSALLSSCGGDASTDELIAKGGKKYGGDFSFMSTEKASTLFPTSTADQYSARIVSQIFEPLMTYKGSDLEVIPAVAESFTVSDDAKEYTFKIRKGVHFHDDPCFDGKEREVKAADVKFTLELACSGLPTNQVSYLLKNRIVGAEDFYNKSNESLPSSGVSGIEVIDDYTIKVKLKDAVPSFERIMAHAGLGIVAKEAYEKYKDDLNSHPVGTGPFTLKSKSDEKIILERNPNYWRVDDFGNQLPFLNTVTVTFAKDKRSELMAFRNSEIDMVLEIPVDEIQNILGTLKDAQEGKNVRHKVDSKKSLSILYIAFACESEEFSDVKVRQAFNYAINRNEIVDNWLEGEGWPATGGIVPDMAGYDNEAVKGVKPNAEKARALLSSAGFSNGQGFPALDFYVNGKEGSSDHMMAKSIKAQLKEVLNVDLNIKLCSIEERKAAISDGTAKIWKAGWIADYPDAENFLNLFYGGNASNQQMMVNSFKFKSDQYDELYDAAQSENDPEKRMKLLTQCDQIIVDQAPVMPILTDDHIVMINARVRDFQANSMESLNLTDIFIKEFKKD